MDRSRFSDQPQQPVLISLSLISIFLQYTPVKFLGLCCASLKVQFVVSAWLLVNKFPFNCLSVTRHLTFIFFSFFPQLMFYFCWAGYVVLLAFPYSLIYLLNPSFYPHSSFHCFPIKVTLFPLLPMTIFMESLYCYFHWLLFCRQFCLLFQVCYD